MSSAKDLINVTNKNVELAGRLKQLTAANEFAESINTPRVSDKKAEMARERRRCETLKGVVQGIIIGSGINWAEDERLMRLVMECGDDS